jgi:hypothetical protein
MQDLCLYDRLADEEIDACLGMEGKGNVRSLHLIGDSHMRVLARYLAPHHNATFQGPWGQTNTEVRPQDLDHDYHLPILVGTTQTSLRHPKHCVFWV